MIFDYRRLRGRIVEKFENQQNFAAEFPMSQRSMSLKLTNKVSFKQPEILRACQLLEIETEDIASYFFTPEV